MSNNKLLFYNQSLLNKNMLFSSFVHSIAPKDIIVSEQNCFYTYTYIRITGGGGGTIQPVIEKTKRVYSTGFQQNFHHSY